MFKTLKQKIKAFWEKHICGPVPEGYDIDANVVTLTLQRQPGETDAAFRERVVKAYHSRYNAAPLGAHTESGAELDYWGRHLLMWSPDLAHVMHAHIEQVPEGTLGRYLISTEHDGSGNRFELPSMEALPPMQNRHRSFAFCFLVTYANGNTAIVHRMSWNVVDAVPLFLDPRLADPPVGYRWRNDNDPFNPWSFGKTAPTAMTATTFTPLYV